MLSNSMLHSSFQEAFKENIVIHKDCPFFIHKYSFTLHQSLHSDEGDARLKTENLSLVDHPPMDLGYTILLLSEHFNLIT